MNTGTGTAPGKVPLFALRKSIDDLYAAMCKANGDSELIAILNEQIAFQRELMKKQWGVDR